MRLGQIALAVALVIIVKLIDWRNRFTRVATAERLLLAMIKSPSPCPASRRSLDLRDARAEVMEQWGHHLSGKAPDNDTAPARDGHGPASVVTLDG